jgi:hypothetical protein
MVNRPFGILSFLRVFEIVAAGGGNVPPGMSGLNPDMRGLNV